MKTPNLIWLLVALIVVVGGVQIFSSTGISGPVGSGAKMFKDPSGIISFNYPNEAVLVIRGEDIEPNWAALATTSGSRIAEVNLPRSFQPNTNFSEAVFTVGSSTDQTAISNCFINPYSDIGTTTVLRINGTQYTRFGFGTAGAGNFYDTTSYRTFHNGVCYAIEYTIHSTNIGNYSPDQGITEFNRAKVRDTLEDIVQSFKFLK